MHTLYMNFLCQAIFIITCTFSTCTESKKSFHYRVEASDVDFLYWQVDKIALRADTCWRIHQVFTGWAFDRKITLTFRFAKGTRNPLHTKKRRYFYKDKTISHTISFFDQSFWERVTWLSGVWSSICSFVSLRAKLSLVGAKSLELTIWYSSVSHSQQSQRENTQENTTIHVANQRVLQKENDAEVPRTDKYDRREEEK